MAQDLKQLLEQFDDPASGWRARAAEGIERYRKGDFTVRVVDKDGAPVTGASVFIDQVGHAFRFGANLFMLDEFDNDEKNARYREIFPTLFNMATLPFYWDANEPKEGVTRYDADAPRMYRRPATDLCVAYCEEKGIEPREHGLAYASFFPRWLDHASVAETKEALRRRFREVARRYADKIPTIEITNEMEWDSVKNAFYYERDYVEWCFRLAEEYFPKNTIAINEWLGASWGDRGKFNDKYFAYIDNALLRGARIDQIGMQYHTFFPRESAYTDTKPYYNPEKLYKHLDLYGSFGKPLEITEVTVPAYSWEPEDEEVQAELIENLYTLWFSHKNMRQIIYWNLVDGYAHVWEPEGSTEEEKHELRRKTQGDMAHGENIYFGGLLRFDMSEKPAFRRLRHLICEKWHTSEACVSDAAGAVRFRGFYGDYQVTVTKDGKEIKATLSLTKDGEAFVRI